jgi:sec-independent protein translocase protein TatA
MLPGPQEWIIILVVVVLLFGAKKIPELASGLGKGLKEFKKAQNEDDHKQINGDEKQGENTTTGDTKKDNDTQT